MIAKEKEIELLKPFVEKPWAKFTFKEIKKLAKQKSESYTNLVLSKFVKSRIIIEEKAGNVRLYSANIHSQKAQVYLGMAAEHIAWERKNIPLNYIEHLGMKIRSSFKTIIVTGSYAREQEKETSDLDVMIIVDNDADPKKSFAEIRMFSETSIPEIHPFVFRESELALMLTNKQVNYGKEAAKNNLIYFGGQNYYRMISEAMKNGFNGENIY